MNKALTALLLLTVAVPAIAATPPATVDSRVNVLEKEMRAVQRKVFPGGAQQYFEPEIQAPAATPAPAGVPADAPVADLTRRVDALERTLSQMTGQIEQNSYNIKQLQDQFAKLKADTDAGQAGPNGVTAASGGASLPYVVPPAPKSATGGATKPAPGAPAPAPTDTAATTPSGDPGKDAYMAGYDLWTAKKFPEAAAALKAMAVKYPKNKYASYARNLAGRSYLDNGQYNEAIREFFDNTKDEAGERAPHSYVYMAQALLKRKPPLPEKACQAYEVLEAKYPDKVTGGLADLVAKGKVDAKCQ
jgi:TolA-binding protein